MPVEDTSDTTTDQEVDTSTNEEAQDTDLSLDSLSFDDDTEETDSPDKDEDAETDQQDDEEDSEEDEATEDSDEQSDDTEETELSEEQKRKEHNREMAERRLEQKRQREQSIEESQQEYLEAAEDEKDVALRQLQVDAYNNTVEKHTNNLTNAYERAIKDFDVLRDESPQIQRELDEALDSFQARFVKLDQYGNPTKVEADLYQYLQSKAESISNLTSMGARKQVQSKGKEKSKTFTQPSRSPKQEKKDPLMDVLLAD